MEIGTEFPIHQIFDLMIFLSRTLLYFKEAYRLPPVEVMAERAAAKTVYKDMDLLRAFAPLSPVTDRSGHEIHADYYVALHHEMSKEHYF